MVGMKMSDCHNKLLEFLQKSPGIKGFEGAFAAVKEQEYITKGQKCVCVFAEWIVRRACTQKTKIHADTSFHSNLLEL